MAAVKKRYKLFRKRSFHRAAFQRAEYCHVIVVATMSAGKTSLINALLGQELLYSANEAATATLTRVCHNRSQRRRISAVSYTAGGQCYERLNDIRSERLKYWNAQDAVRYIDVSCHIGALCKTHSPMVLYDTPGANNSQDDVHRRIWLEALRQPGKSLVIYVLNASSLATRDDDYLLREIAPCVGGANNRRILFILNKMDELDEDKGETVAGYLSLAKRYLEQTGFSGAMIIPAMLQTSLIAKQILNRKSVTRSQRNRLRGELCRFRRNKHALNDPALIPEKIKYQVRSELKKQFGNDVEKTVDVIDFNKSELSQFIAYSGIRALEIYLSHYN